MICHNVPFTTRTKFKKGVISYFKTNEITISKKMWMQNIYYLQKFEEEVNNHARSGLERQLAKKRLNLCIGGGC